MCLDMTSLWIMHSHSGNKYTVCLPYIDELDHLKVIHEVGSFEVLG